MLPTLSSLLLLTLPLIFLASMAEARPLLQPDIGANGTLAARLQLADNASSSTCWDSLFELQSCSSEVILFFLNGETYLGPECCDAIHTIEHHCWASMLPSFGFTSDETNVLRGYCDAASNSSSPSPPSTPDFLTASAAAAAAPGINHSLVPAPAPE